MEKTITIGEHEQVMRASARSPILYRALLGRDMIQDMKTLEADFKRIKALKDAGEEADLSAEDLTIFANACWIFLKQGGEGDQNNGQPLGKSPMEWLDTIPNVFAIYAFIKDVLELWYNQQLQTAKPAKK